MPEKSHPRPFSAWVGGVFMSAQKTEHYQLHQWDPGDDFLRAEFNENFAALDASVRIVFGSYVGDRQATRFIDLGATPRAVLLMGANNNTKSTDGGLAFPGIPAVYGADNYMVLSVEEGGFNVYYRSSPYVESNNSNYAHHYIAFI